MAFEAAAAWRDKIARLKKLDMV
ncbi:MAG: UvrB/UvrC motif-containing protein [Nitrospinae bacterium]|nr:UvrB/UvrC motif-containing protein [Nitrospinota bacterium]